MERPLLILLALILLSVPSTHLYAQNLEIRFGDRSFEIESREVQGETLYRIRDLLQILDLSQQELGNQLRLNGPRGTLTLVDSRPLVRSGDQYILLSSNVWRRRSGDWYVPRDFFEKALPNVLASRLSRDGPNAYSIESLVQNQVRVEFLTYPDHHSVVFRPRQPTNGKVQEFRNYLEVSFENSLIHPAFVQLPNTTQLISNIAFTPQEGLGTFRIVKGPAFDYFREYQLSNPSRFVVDVYGTIPDETEALVVDRPEAREIPAPQVEEESIMSDSSGSEADRLMRKVDLVLDPGHGGEQYGVDVQQDTLEKGIALNLARLIEARLRSHGMKVALTRTRDVSLPVEQRSSVANFRQPRTFLSLHVGASSSPEIRGAVVYVFDPQTRDAAEDAIDGSLSLLGWDTAQVQYSSESQRLANLLQTRLNEFFESENQVVRARLAVLAPIKSPAVVVETGFLTNERDLELLSDPDTLQELAYRIADILDRFLNTL